MENFYSINKVVNFSHEAFHENNFRETNAHVPQFSRESLTKMVESISKNWKIVILFPETDLPACH